jgi:hypothetical protein
MSEVEKAVLILVEGALGNPTVTKGTYKSLDTLAARSQCGFLSTFTNCPDTITQLTGASYYALDQLKVEFGEKLSLCVLKDKSAFSAFGEIISITGQGPSEILKLVDQKLATFSILVIEIVSLAVADALVAGLLPSLDDSRLSVCLICGYADHARVPTFPVPPVVDPSWKVIGPDVLAELSVDRPYLFVSASKNLTRVDKVNGFDENEIRINGAMGVLPICQIFREYSYYTGSSWKYGA